MEVKEERKEMSGGGGVGERGGPVSSRKPEEWAAGDPLTPGSGNRGGGLFWTHYGSLISGQQFSEISLGLESLVSLTLVTPWVPGVA